MLLLCYYLLPCYSIYYESFSWVNTPTFFWFPGLERKTAVLGKNSDRICLHHRVVACCDSPPKGLSQHQMPRNSIRADFWSLEV